MIFYQPQRAARRGAFEVNVRFPPVTDIGEVSPIIGVMPYPTIYAYARRASIARNARTSSSVANALTHLPSLRA